METHQNIRVGLPAGVSDDEAYRALSVLQAGGAVWLGLRDDLDPPAALAVVPGDDPDLARTTVEGALRAAAVPFSGVEARPARMLDWQGTWDAALRPTAIGPLWIVPPGEHAPPGTGYVLHLDAGEAFGTGFHPTTTLCLEDIVERSPTPELLDVGTGSGVLALAALTLGAPRATATDHDPVAREQAAANARANSLHRRITITETPVGELGRQFPLVYANILAAPLTDLAPELLRAVSRGGVLLLSGVRDSQVDDVAKAYKRAGARVLGKRSQAGWTLLEFAPPW